MVRYQSSQNIKKQLEQNQLLPRKNTSLRKNTVLRTKTETTLKTNNTASRNRTETKLKLKRKLLVYKKDDKFYIDHFAAYALGLTNVKAIMLEDPRLIEVGLETLYKFQNNEEIEIEYQELNKEKDVTSSKGDLEETLGGLEQGKYGIGVHGIDTGSSAEKESKALNISSEGLNISNNSKTILSTAISLGTNEKPQKLSQDIAKYKFGNGTRMMAVIAAPLYIKNKNGEKIFLGFPEENKKTAGQQYEEHCILDRICGKLNKIPPEFILGYYCENPDGSKAFTKNLKHYSNISQDSKEDLYKELSSNMDDISRNINELIADGNIEQLSQMRERMQQRNMNTYMLDNAMVLAQKYKEPEKMQFTKKIDRRKIILREVQQNEPSSDFRKNKKKRKILLDLCQDVNLSDLPDAKGILREGMKEQEKSYEGKEI